MSFVSLRKLIILAMPVAVFGCSEAVTVAPPQELTTNQSGTPNPYGDSIFDMQKSDANETSASSSVSANALLWQSTLETIGFMGIRFIDPSKGVIITDWYKPSGMEVEFQTITTINSQVLASASLHVQVATKSMGELTSSGETMASRLKDAILLKAREKRSNKSN